jgi:hypothetical protein
VGIHSSLRYNVAQGALQPFVKAGYGRSWYRMTDATFNGQLLGNGSTRWVLAGVFRSLLPNTWHVGAGLGSFLIAQDAHVTRVHFNLGTTLSF